MAEAVSPQPDVCVCGQPPTRWLAFAALWATSQPDVGSYIEGRYTALSVCGTDHSHELLLSWVIADSVRPGDHNFIVRVEEAPSRAVAAGRAWAMQNDAAEQVGLRPIQPPA